MENTDKENKDLLRSELAKMAKAATTFGKNLRDTDDSILLVGCISDGKNTHAEMIFGGAAEKMADAIAKAMQKEIGIAKIIIEATTQYLDAAIKSEDLDAAEMILSVLSSGERECNCPKCRQRREQRKEWN